MSDDSMGTAPNNEVPQAHPERIRFHYIKAPLFHTVHADGAVGGLTPRGLLHVAFYAERIAIPQQVEHVLTEEGTLGPEVVDRRVVRDGIVRELTVDVVMDVGCAGALYEWLGQHLKGVEVLRKESEK